MDIHEVISILEKYYKSDRRTTLNRMRKKPNPFKILISCLISLRVKDETTERITKELFKAADTPEKILKLPIKKLERIIYSSGYYKNKAKTLKHVSKVILNKYKGNVPNSEEELLSIKGIGRKTANIVLSFAFNKQVLPIDTHCHRIPNRIGWIKTKTPEETEEELMKILPKQYWNEFNGIFVLFGKEICRPVLPKCSICPINKYCKKVGVKSSR